VLKLFTRPVVACFLIVCTVVACAGRTSSTLPTNSVHQQTIKRLASVNGRFPTVNDVPRKISANFESRRGAAHARGVWLTDELNVRHKIRKLGRVSRGNHGAVPSSSVRQTQVEQTCGESQDSCDPGGGGGSGDGGYDITEFDDNGGNDAYDTELDFADGTSMLFEEWTDDAGDEILTTLNPDGSYEVASSTEGKATPEPQATPVSGPCYAMMDGNAVSYPSCNFRLPKWACPYIAGAGGLAAKWATAAGTKNGQAGDTAGLAVGASLLQSCNALTFLRVIEARRHQFATQVPQTNDVTQTSLMPADSFDRSLVNQGPRRSLWPSASAYCSGRLRTFRADRSCPGCRVRAVSKAARDVRVALERVDFEAGRWHVLASHQ
jgi:hypothetical protein